MAHGLISFESASPRVDKRKKRCCIAEASSEAGELSHCSQAQSWASYVTSYVGSAHGRCVEYKMGGEGERQGETEGRVGKGQGRRGKEHVL